MYTNLDDIPQFTRSPSYHVNVSWDYLEKWLALNSEENHQLDLNPDFQRGHVWTPEQQSRYVEFRLRGGRSGRDIFFNHPGWMGSFKGTMEIVDGLQRLTAVRKFLANEVPVFGKTLLQYADHERGLRRMMGTTDFVVHVNDLKTRAEVLTWYLEMNSGGTPHTEAELDRVRRLLIAEEK